MEVKKSQTHGIVRRPVKVAASTDLLDALDALAVNMQLHGMSREEVYEHALFFGLPATRQLVEQTERALERARQVELQRATETIHRAASPA